ncbi:MAG: hypothetical protein JNM17_28040 [Archangium sp.]|nr:hypothetical protein [Archangium sp.]
MPCPHEAVFELVERQLLAPEEIIERAPQLELIERGSDVEQRSRRRGDAKPALVAAVARAQDALVNHHASRVAHPPPDGELEHTFIEPANAVQRRGREVRKNTPVAEPQLEGLELLMPGLGSTGDAVRARVHSLVELTVEPRPELLVGQMPQHLFPAHHSELRRRAAQHFDVTLHVNPP